MNLHANISFRRLAQGAGYCIGPSFYSSIAGLNNCVPQHLVIADSSGTGRSLCYRATTGKKEKKEEGPPSADIVVFINKLSFPFFFVAF